MKVMVMQDEYDNFIIDLEDQIAYRTRVNVSLTQTPEDRINTLVDKVAEEVMGVFKLKLREALTKKGTVSP